MMKKLFIITALNFISLVVFSQTSQVVRFHSPKKVIKDFVSNTQKEYDENSLVVMDFDSKTISVSPNQFKLDITGYSEDQKFPEKNITVLNFDCKDETNKKCKVSVFYKGDKATMVALTFDDYDYMYFID